VSTTLFAYGKDKYLDIKKGPQGLTRSPLVREVWKMKLTGNVFKVSTAN
jgi:hypothetical protein